MPCIDHGGAEKQVQLKLSLLGIVAKTETDEHPRCALRMQSRSGWGEWGRWRQQQPIRLCPIDAADGWDGMARVPPALRLGKNTISTKKPAAECSGVAWRLARRAHFLWVGEKRASRESQPRVECCCVRRQEGFAGAKKGLLLPAPNDIRGFFFFVARWKLLSRKLSSIFFLATRSLALAMCLATQSKRSSWSVQPSWTAAF